MQRRLIFEGSKLSDVVQEFNRYNRRQLVIEGAQLSDFHVSGVYSSTDPASLIRFLREQPGMKVTEDENEVPHHCTMSGRCETREVRLTSFASRNTVLYRHCPISKPPSPRARVGCTTRDAVRLTMFCIRGLSSGSHFPTVDAMLVRPAPFTGILSHISGAAVLGPLSKKVVDVTPFLGFAKNLS